MILETVDFRNYALAGRLAYLNLGTLQAAQIIVYGETRPASALDAPGSLPLVMINLQDPAGTIENGVLTLLAAEAGQIIKTGVGTWARVVTRSGFTAFDMDVSLEAGEGECVLSQTQLFAGGLVSLVSAALG